MAIYFFLVEGSGGFAPKANEKYHLVALKIRLEAHIFVLSVAMVAAEMSAAAAAAAVPQHR